MPLLSLRAVTLSLGGPPLLEAVDLHLERGERVALIGRNGVGKSSLLRLLAGELHPDEGLLQRAPGLRVARLAQDAPEHDPRSVRELVAAGSELHAHVAAYEHLSQHAARAPEALHQLAAAQHQLEAAGGWTLDARIAPILARLGLDPDATYDTLSGGLRRRALLAQALIAAPDLLLLDEPTNHLDLERIVWLEKFLLEWRGALLFITHDRRFLRRLATRILELDRGCLTDWPGDYDGYVRRRAERLAAESAARARFDKHLAEEERWIRQGIEARRTRNEGRVRALEALRAARRARREQPGQVNLRLDRGVQSGKLVIETRALSFRWDDGAPVVAGLNTLILRGDRVGIIGPNGAGKTTLIKLLLGELTPTGGEIRRGTNLRVAYFDQQRAQLDPAASVRDNVAGGRERIAVNGAEKHVIGYLGDFLFTPDRARQPVAALSGGERNRLLLAKLFAQPANLLVLDEPTNDLDLETLELLEELLHEFDGTLLLVSHDREFLDRLVTSTLVLEGEGRVGEYVGGYSDWLRQRTPPAPVAKPAPHPPKPRAPPLRLPSAKLGYRERQELERLPQRIEDLENERAALHERLADPAFYRAGGAEVGVARARLPALEAELEALYARWETLEALRAKG